MLRFTTRENKNTNKVSRGYMAYMLLPVLLVIFYLIISSLRTSTIERQLDSLNGALNRDIIHCYAVEGYYPPSLDYLKEHYGLTYDEELFIVDYHPVAANMKPTYTVLISQAEVKR